MWLAMSSSIRSRRLLDAAAAVGQNDAAERQRAWLRDANDGVRYWAAVGLSARDTLSPADREALRAAQLDDSPTVRIEAAAALARHGEAAVALPVLTTALQDQSVEVRLHAARALELLGEAARPAHAEMQAALAAAREQESSGSNLAMFVRFSLEAALQD